MFKSKEAFIYRMFSVSILLTGVSLLFYFYPYGVAFLSTNGYPTEWHGLAEYKPYKGAGIVHIPSVLFGSILIAILWYVPESGRLFDWMVSKVRQLRQVS